MGKKIQCIGRYAMDGVTLGKGSFATVELATHALVNAKVSSPHRHQLSRISPCGLRGCKNRAHSVS